MLFQSLGDLETQNFISNSAKAVPTKPFANFLSPHIMLPTRTGVVYDERMQAHKERSGYHPECPERIDCIWKALNEADIVSNCLRSSASKRCYHGKDSSAAQVGRQNMYYRLNNSVMWLIHKLIPYKNSVIR